MDLDSIRLLRTEIRALASRARLLKDDSDAGQFVEKAEDALDDACNQLDSAESAIEPYDPLEDFNYVGSRHHY